MVNEHLNWPKDYSHDTPRVLLIGECVHGSSSLVKRLEKYGCKCRFAAFYEEAIARFVSQDFDLVLSPMRLRNASAFPLVSRLEGSKTYLFYYQPVEDGCWWLPALRAGQKCFGSAALRPSDFAVRLEQIIGEIRARLRAAATSTPAALPATGVAPAWRPAPIASLKPLRAAQARLIKHTATR